MCEGNNHHFVCSGSGNNTEVPEGLPCICGMTHAHYKTCPCCGERTLKPETSELVKNPSPYEIQQTGGDIPTRMSIIEQISNWEKGY